MRRRVLEGLESKTVSIMDIAFQNKTKQEFLQEDIYPRIAEGKKSFIVTANPEIVMKTREDASYKSKVQTADYIVPDGAGILMAAKWMKQPLKERVAGFDLMLDLLAHANEKGLGVYFLGAKEEVNHKAVLAVKEKYPNLQIAGQMHGYFDINDAGIADEVRESEPDIILAALGFPRQEEWITKYMNEFSKGIFIGVGGSFDVLAGEVKRAPQIWIKLNLEWLYRLIQQPSRIKRVFKLFEFILRIIFKRY